MSGSELVVSAESADAWGAPLRVPGSSGHMNVASGLGKWPEGRQCVLLFAFALHHRSPHTGNLSVTLRS